MYKVNSYRIEFKNRLQGERSWAETPALPWTKCVTLAKFVHLSKLQLLSGAPAFQTVVGQALQTQLRPRHRLEENVVSPR